MKYTLVILLTILFLLTSCRKEDNPIIVPVENVINYSGKVGSEKVFRITTKWLRLNTNIPFYSIPDSLINQISFPDSLRKQGVIEIGNLRLKTVAIDAEYYNKFKTNLSKEYFKEEYADWTYQSLDEEYRTILTYRNYYPIDVHNVFWDRWLETPDSLVELFSIPSNSLILKKPLKEKSLWIRGSLKISDGNGGYATYQEEGEVMEYKEIKIEAGTFLAYKIAVVTHWLESNIRIYGTYEYYVPNLGLILEESNGILESSAKDLYGNKVYYDQIYRKELISYKN